MPKVKKMTDKDLKREFDNLNEFFFDNRIVLNDVFFSDMRGASDAAGAYFNVRKQIVITTQFRGYPRMVTELLLHEMAHAHLDLQGYRGYPADGGHGSLFQVEIDRLYKAGAYDGIL